MNKTFVILENVTNMYKFLMTKNDNCVYSWTWFICCALQTTAGLTMVLKRSQTLNGTASYYISNNNWPNNVWY